MIEIFEPNRGYKGLVKKSNKERIIINNRDLPFSTCVVAKDDYIEADNNKHLPVLRVSVLVTADNHSEGNINTLIVTNDTNGDLTKNTDVDFAYDKIIMGNNSENYYYGITDKKDLNGYYTKDSHMVYVNKNEMCYVGIRLIFDDGC